MAYYRTFAWLCIYLTLVFAVGAVEEVCERKKCPGPLTHYLALDCTPIYEIDRCCPIRYNCDHLYERFRNKCYLNGHEYEIGEKIREEDANVCEKDCICTNDKENDLIDFNCTTPECPQHNYTCNHFDQCCPIEDICPNESEDVGSVCEANGKIYLPGDYVLPEEKPNSVCICERNITGAYSLSCIEFNRLFNIHAAAAFYHKCIPIYLPHKGNMTRIYSQHWACQNDIDSVIQQNNSNPVKSMNDKQLCILAELTMQVGDKYNSSMSNDSYIACTCEVPPVPTCILKQNVTSNDVPIQKRF